MDNFALQKIAAEVTNIEKVFAVLQKYSNKNDMSDGVWSDFKSHIEKIQN